MLNMHRNGVYRMPAEWETQKSTWIAWPHNKEDWPGKFNEIPIKIHWKYQWKSTGNRVEISI